MTLVETHQKCPRVIDAGAPERGPVKAASPRTIERGMMATCECPGAAGDAAGGQRASFDGRETFSGSHNSEADARCYCSGRTVNTFAKRARSRPPCQHTFYSDLANLASAPTGDVGPQVSGPSCHRCLRLPGPPNQPTSDSATTWTIEEARAPRSETDCRATDWQRPQFGQ